MLDFCPQKKSPYTEECKGCSKDEMITSIIGYRKPTPGPEGKGGSLPPTPPEGKGEGKGERRGAIPSIPIF